MTERPTPDLTILETRVYRGANIWSYEQAIHLVVDLGRLEDHPTNTLPGFTEHLLGCWDDGETSLLQPVASAR